MNVSRKEKALIVDSDTSIYHELKEVLDDRIALDYIERPLDGLAQILSQEYVLVIASETFEEMSGLSFLLAVMKINPRIRTFYITDEMDDRKELQALEMGINCVFARSRSIKTMAYHVELLIRKSLYEQNRDLILYGDGKIKVDVKAHSVMIQDKTIALTPKEFEILVLLLQNKNKVLERSRIVQEIWKEHYERVDERTVDVHIKRLRDKLKTHSIVSVRGFGYRWHEK